MNLTPEQREQVVAELKRFGADLQLTDDQKSRLQEFLVEARTKVGDYLQANPNATRADITKQVAANRDQLRQRLVNFLNPDQLKKWDAEVSKAKEFLGQQIAAWMSASISVASKKTGGHRSPFD
jgi:periplasmic protein CpxP/Spy